MKKESKITQGANYLIRTNEKHLKSLELLKPLELEHKDIEKSKQYKKLLEFYVKFGKEILTLEDNNDKLKDAITVLIDTADKTDQVDFQELKKLGEFL